MNVRDINNDDINARESMNERINTSYMHESII